MRYLFIALLASTSVAVAQQPPRLLDSDQPASLIMDEKAHRVAPAAANVPFNRSFDQRLTALELALSTIVSEQPGLWRFEPLETEATALLLLARNESDRQAVRALAERLSRFAAIGERYRNDRATAVADTTRMNRTTESKFEPNWNAVSQSDRLAPPVRRTKAREPKQALASNSEYDAVGVLRPVVSKRADAPKYAIVGDDGKLLTFVTPARGVDNRFDQLLGKRIGVRGVRGYRTDLRREHLTAERVTPLETLLR